MIINLSIVICFIISIVICLKIILLYNKQYNSIKKIYHYHTTISNCTSDELKFIAKSLKAKPTSIDLYNDKFNQIDRMITKYSTNKEELMSIMLSDNEIISKLGFNITRNKIEEVTKTLQFDRSALYTEAHIRVLNNNLKNISGMKLSNNVNDGTKFYNVRIYDKDELSYALRNIKTIDNIISIQNEIVHFDSNSYHDKWW